MAPSVQDRPVLGLDRTVARNAAWILVAQVANLVLPLVTLPYLARRLGPDQFGAFAFSQALAVALSMLTDYGFNLSATKRVAEFRNDTRRISETFWNVQAAKLALAVISGFVLLVATALVSRFRELSALLFASFPLVVGSVVFPQWLFQGVERMMAGTVCLMTARVAVILSTFAFVRGPSDTVRAALINSAALVLASLVAVLFIRRGKIVTWVRPTWTGVQRSLRDGWHVFASMAAISMYTSASSIVLGLVADNAAVGVFAAVDKIRLMCQGALTPLSSAAYPRVNALMKEDRQGAFALIRRLLALQVGGTLLISMALLIFAPEVVMLVIGQRYGSAATVLRWMALLPLVISFSNVLGVQTMLPLGMERAFSRILIVSGLTNLVLIVPLGTSLRETGAAVSVLLTETLVSALMAGTLWMTGVRIWAKK